MHSNLPEEIRIRKIIYSSFLILVFLVFLFFLLFLSSCQYIPDMAKDIDDIATDTAIKIEVSRETFQKDTDLDISVQVNNKDHVGVKP